MRRALLLAVLALLAIGTIYWALSEWRRSQKRDHLLLFGNVDVRQVDLGFRVAGRVASLYFEEGDLVQQGDLAGVLDKVPYNDQVVEALANIETIKATLQNAEKILQRRQELIRDGSVSQEDLDNALSQVAVQTANLKQAQAALAIARANLQFTEVYAPVEGTILTRIREPGTVVNPGDPVLTLSILSPVWIRAFVSQPELGLIYPGMPAEIFTDTPGSPVYKGHIGFISPVAEFTPKTVETTQLRTDLVYRLRIYAENPDRGLRQGMPVTVRLPLKEKR
jgi:HlyD family secretion protein